MFEHFFTLRRRAPGARRVHARAISCDPARARSLTFDVSLDSCSFAGCRQPTPLSARRGSCHLCRYLSTHNAPDNLAAAAITLAALP